MFDTIVFPTDGSDGAAAALATTMDLAVAHDATVHAVYVIEDIAPQKSVAEVLRSRLRRRGEDVLDAVVTDGGRRGVPVETHLCALEETVSGTILGVAADVGADVIVVPRRGRRGVSAYLLGSVTQRLTQRAPIPVLTVPVDEGS